MFTSRELFGMSPFSGRFLLQEELICFISWVQRYDGQFGRWHFAGGLHLV